MRAIKYAMRVIGFTAALWCSAIGASTKDDATTMHRESAFAYFLSTIPLSYQEQFGEPLPTLSRHALDSTLFNPVTAYYYQSLHADVNVLSRDGIQSQWTDWETMMHVCYAKKIRPDMLRERIKYTLFQTKRSLRHVSFCQKETLVDVLPAKPFAETIQLYQKNLPLSYAKRFYRQYDAVGHKVEQQYGVPYSILVAILGTETAWGRTVGDFTAIPTLATLTFMVPEKQEYLLSLLAYLHILPTISQLNLDQTHLTTFDGGMGMVQFQPNNYIPYAVDFDRQLIPNIWTDMPDALASVANYLHQHGWQQGTPWGYQVTVPSHHSAFTTLAMNRTLRPLSFWVKQGVKLSHGLTHDEQSIKAYLYLPNKDANATQGFLLTPNFTVLMRWNPSTIEALMIGMMATQLDKQSK